jgi:hypothetical protein
MTQPLEQTVTFKQGGAPSSVTAFPKQPQGAAASTGAAAAGRAGSPSKAASRGGGGKPGAAGGAGERVLRTVFLPTVDSDFLLLKVESLQAQLNEQVRMQLLVQRCTTDMDSMLAASAPSRAAPLPSAICLCLARVTWVNPCAGLCVASCRSSCMRSGWQRC